MWSQMTNGFVFYLCLWSSTNGDHTVWTPEQLHTIQGISDMLCPSTRYCTNITSNKDSSSSRKHFSCCKGCSCDPECGLHNNCCYDYLDQHRYLEKGYMKCMSAHTAHSLTSIGRIRHNVDYDQHLFFVGTPDDECGYACEPSDLVPWKTLYPVYFPRTQMNFINEKCARCHGVTEGVKWKSLLVYLTGLNRRVMMGGILDVLENKFMDPSSYALFLHPGTRQEQLNTLCSTNIRDTCSHRYVYNTHFGLNISKHIIEACTKGPTALYQNYGSRGSHLDKNVFCALCNGLGENACGVLDIGRTTNVPFMTLLDDRMLRVLTEETTTEMVTAKQQLACQRDENNTESCREVLCPMLQVKSPGGTCYQPSKIWYFHIFYVHLNLTSKIQETMNGEVISEPDMRSIMEKHSPWDVSWKIHAIFTRIVEQSSWKNLEIVITLYRYVQGGVEPNTFLGTLEFTLSKQWPIRINNSTVNMQQELSRQMPKAQKSTVPLPNTIPIWAQNDAHQGLEIPVWTQRFKDLRATMIGPKSFRITKLLFCKQIELKAGEFIFLDETQLVLYYTSAKKILYSSEFSVSSFENSEQLGRVTRVKICVEDADIYLLTDAANITNGFTATLMSILVGISNELIYFGR